MAWLKVESSVRTNRKFLLAGPAASWLWLCGLTYCKEGLTDGFIPAEAVDYLGVPKPQSLVPRLVKAGLWEPVVGGWLIHDFLHYNLSAAEVAEQRAVLAEAGARGGRAVAALKARYKSALRPQAKAPDEPQAKAADTSQAQSPGKSREEKSREEERRGECVQAPPFDRWLGELQSLYPGNRVTHGYLTESAFLEQFQRDSREASVVWTEMRANLENQKRGYEWRAKEMIPSLDKWLREGRWRQRHDPAPSAATRMSDATATTLAAASAILQPRRDE